jgi:hypothetical protein
LAVDISSFDSGIDETTPDLLQSDRPIGSFDHLNKRGAGIVVELLHKNPVAHADLRRDRPKPVTLTIAFDRPEIESGVRH